jgi:hypothetical protein
MKKVSLFLSKELQGLMDSEQKFRTSNLVKNALALVAFVTEMALTGDRPRITFPVYSPNGDYLNPKWNDAGFFLEVFKVTNRVEIHLRSGQVPGAGIVLEVEFYLPGKNLAPTLMIEGYAEDSSVRCLRFKGYNPGRMVKQGRPKED